MEEPMISRAEGTVIFPSKVSGVLITLGGIHPVATIRMERYEAIMAGQYNVSHLNFIFP
jgi:hypothetical protein